MIRPLLLLVVILPPSIVAAQSSISTSCDSANTTIEIRRCASRALEDVRQDLDRYVKEARRVATNRALLDSAQSAWEHFRDVACRAAGGQYKGGTMEPVVVLYCLLAQTRRRLRELYDDYLRTTDTPLPEPKK